MPNTMLEKPSGHIDVADVKLAASGRWPEILSSLGGIPSDVLQDSSTREHPCPQSGGNTRFRFTNRGGNGSVFCSHCCRDVGDGISALMWARGIDFREALAQLADYLDVTPVNGRRSNGKPPKGQSARRKASRNSKARLGPIDHAKLERWCDSKPPILPTAAKLFQPKSGRWHESDCIAFNGVDLAGNVRATLLYRFDGSEFPAVGKLPARKTHLERGSHNSWLLPGGTQGNELLKSAHTIVKTEGLPDALAIVSAGLPDGWVAATNACGCRAAGGLDYSFTIGNTVVVVGDADQPGQMGAREFALKFAAAGADPVRLVSLPYDVDESHGRDVRDWLCEGNTLAEFQRLVDAGEVVTAAQRTLMAAEQRVCMIVINSATTPVADTLHEITDRLLAAGNCFNRADQLVVIHGETIIAILSPQELAGLLNEHVEFFFGSEESGHYKPLPPAYASTWLYQRAERARLPEIKLFTRNPVYTEDWRLIASGFDKQSGIYCAGPAVEARAGTPHLDALLRDFCFKAPGDRTNYIGVLLTALLIPRFIGSKPAVLFNGNQPELGKSILAQIIAILRDGQPTETATYNPNDEEFEKRIGAIVRRGVTTIVIDNAKGRSRNPRIESACLERSITDPILSFRLLGYSSEIRAENSHIFAITANSTDVSRDLVTRSAVVNLYHEGDPVRRAFSILDPEGYAQEHRLELLGELVGMVERWKTAGMPKADVRSRFNKRGWGTIVGGILEANRQVDFLANANEAAALLDETRREFAELVSMIADRQQAVWTAGELVKLCVNHSVLAADLGEGSPRSLSTKMGTLAGRFVSERFPLGDGRHATYQRSDSRKGKVYQVKVKASAEPAEPCRTSGMA